MEIELERTFLLKYIPEGLDKCKFIEIEDIYIPAASEHPVLRIRRKGNKFEITKKQPVSGTDSSEQSEHTIILSEEEYKDLSKLKGKRFRKIRYYYPCDSGNAEIDIFEDDLDGLAVVDFEFNLKSEKDNFKMPDFCLADVTQDRTIAGGILAGKKFSDIKSELEKYGHKELRN